MSNKKLCIDCLIPKDYSEFHSNKRSFDGKTNVCKKCTKTVNADNQIKLKPKNDKSIKQRAECREDDAPKKAKTTKEKICIDCLFKLDISEFYDYARSLDGKRRSCKSCMAKVNAKGYDKRLRAEKAAKIRAESRKEDAKKEAPAPVKVKEKYCNKCHRKKAMAEFFNDKNSDDGTVPICKLCSSNVNSKKKRAKIDVDRIKKIMARPVNPKYTQFYWMPKKPSVVAPLRFR